MNVNTVALFEKAFRKIPRLKIDFLKQNAMRSVVNSLIPVVAGSIYFFGWRSLVIIIVSIISCVLTEWIFVRNQKAGKVSEAAFVTAVLYGLILPPTLPFYMVILGAIFGMTFGKMAFGGFGMNVFNPALVARAFVYISFPIQSTSAWIPAAGFADFPGGLLAWLYGKGTVTALTSATPLSAFRDGATTLPGLWQLFWGDIHGQFERFGETIVIGGGSVGETSALLIALGGLYLVYKKVANWKIVASFFGAFLIFQTILHYVFPDKVGNLLFGLFAGGVMFGGFYMVTDPISASRTEGGKILCPALAALLIILIRAFSLFAEGVMFAILLTNTFTPIIDYAIQSGQPTLSHKSLIKK
jgi:Na+-transporting NADH:ubiquinone oxidoreductase subunit B